MKHNQKGKRGMNNMQFSSIEIIYNIFFLIKESDITSFILVNFSQFARLLQAEILLR